MTNKPTQSNDEHGLGAALKDLLNRARQGASDLLGLLNPAPRPAYQPVPVRQPTWRARRSASGR
jgi:hypothetical protein